MPPYPVERCADCQESLADEAYLFRDMEDGKLCVICGTCAPHLELKEGLRFRLIAL